MTGKINILVLAIGLSFVAFLSLHSQYFSEDLILHVPFIQKNLDGSIYPDDYIFKYNIPQQTVTFFYPFTAICVRLLPFPLQTNMRILYFIYLLLLNGAIVVISKKISRSMLPGIFLSLLLMLNFQIGGTAIHTIEVDFLPRGIGFAIALWATYFLYRRQSILVICFYIVAFLFHPPTTCFLIIVTMLYFVLKKHQLRTLVNVFMLFLPLCIIVAVFLQLRIPQNWLNILLERNKYAFIQLWSVKSWVTLALVIMPGALFTIYPSGSSKNLSNLFIASFIGAGLASIGSLFFTTFYPLSFIIALQLGRMWVFPSIISLLCLAYIVTIYTTKIQQRLLIFLLIVLVFVLNNVRYADGIDQNWLDAQIWAHASSAKQCIFLVPFNSKAFRVNSQRTITGEYKDGTFSFYSYEFAKNWQQRREDLTNWELKPDSFIFQLEQKYHFTYIVDRAGAVRNFPVVYKNRSFQIFQTSNNCSL